jgi:hypothetical protein
MMSWRPSCVQSNRARSRTVSAAQLLKGMAGIGMGGGGHGASTRGNPMSGVEKWPRLTSVMI